MKDMGLFDPQLTPEAIQIINDNAKMVNANISEWVKNQNRSSSNIGLEVVNYLTAVKRRLIPQQKPIKLTPERKSKIEKLCKRGHTWKEFKGVIDWIVPEWYGTKLQPNLQPETIFASKNFQKYLEQAREAWLSDRADRNKKSGREVSGGNQYDKLLS